MARAIGKNNKREKKVEKGKEIRYLYIYILQISFSDGPHKYKSGIKHFSSSISSKNMYLVESISKILTAVFCLAAFFWEAGSLIQA